MKKLYAAFSKGSHLAFLLIFFLCATSLFSQLRFSEVSGDSGNNDGTNDGIVELLNIGTVDFDAGCYVISNSEWIVVLPPGTIIPAGGVFLIACSQGQNTGTNPNPVPGSGLACNTCDFPNLPIDFDVCDPANAAYVDWAASGFTIDNQNDTDGDQIVLFAPNGSIVQAVKWGGGATSIYDNTAVQTGAYTLGTPGTGGSGLSSAELPPALLPNGACWQMGVNYVMPIITDPVYEDLTTVPNSGGKAINKSVLQGCNSSFIYDPIANSWRKTDHPNPGLPNNIPAYQFSFSNSLTQCAIALTPVTVTLEVYNWQAVTPGVVNAKGGVGSFVTFDGGATIIPWDTYVRNDATGVTTMTYTFTPTGNATLNLVWDDDKSSLFASTPTGSTSPTAVVNNTTPSDCYTVAQYQVVVVQPMMVSKTDISCPADFPAGVINVGSLVSGGLGVGYELFDNGISQGSNNSGVFFVSNSLTGPITIVITDGSGCTPPITVNVNNNCRQAPVCPANLAYDACTTPSGNACPGDNIQLSIDAATATGLPNGGTIEWMRVNNPADDPYMSGEVVAVQTITTTTTGSNCPADGFTVVINRIIIRPATGDGGGGGEYFQLVNLGPCPADISGYRFTYGSSSFGSVFTHIVPSSTTLACGAFYQAASNVAFSNSNGGFWLVDNTNTVIQSIGYGTGSTGGISGGINYPATTGNLSFPASRRGIYRTSSCNYAANDIEITLATGGPNTAAVGGQCPADCSTPMTTITLTPTCASYAIPANACNSTVHLRPRIRPLADVCGNPTLPARSYDVICPTAVLTGGGAACAGNPVPLLINFENYIGTPTFTIYYTIDGVAQPPIVTTDDPYILNATTAGEYVLTSVTVSGNCSATASGSATVEINPVPDVSLSGVVEVCAGLIAEIPLTINNGTLPFVVNYDVNGGAPQTVEVFSNQINLPTDGLMPGDYTLTIAAVSDDQGCSGSATGSATIRVRELPDPMSEPDPEIICYSGSGTLDLEFFAIEVPIGVATDWYDAPSGGNLLQLGGASYSQIVTPTGPYPQRFSVYVQTRNIATGCVNPNRTPVHVDVYIAPNLANLPVQTNICPANTVNLTTLTVLDSNSTTGTLSYHTTQAGAETDNLTDLVTNPSAVGAGTYYIRKQLNALEDCFDVVTVVVQIQECCILPTVSLQPKDTAVCESDETTFSVAATAGGSLSYQWQENSGSGFVNLLNSGVYSGTTTDVLTISNTTGLNGRQYRVIVTSDNNTPNNNSDDCQTISDTATLTLASKPMVSISPDSAIVCRGDNLILQGKPTGGTGSYTHAWTGSGAASLNATSVASPTFNSATSGNFTLIYTVTASGCSASDTVEVRVLPCDITISDPCRCKNNATTLEDGQFEETVEIIAPSGQTWTVTATNGLFDSSSPNPPAAPINNLVGSNFIETNNGNGTSTYRLTGMHIDAQGFTLMASNGGVSRSIGNTCYYPNSEITGLDAAYCENDKRRIFLTATIDRGDGTPAATPDAQLFAIFNGMTPVFDPAVALHPLTLGAGVYTVRYTVDAAAEGATFPGCIQSVTQNVRIDPIITVDAGATQAICRTKILALSTLNPVIIYNGEISALQYVWGIVETGNNGVLSGTSAANPMQGNYTPGPDAVARGYVTLRLTVDNPNDACNPVSDIVIVRILKVDCGVFPLNEN